MVYMGTRAHVETGSLVHKCPVLVPKIGESGGRCSGQRMGVRDARDRSNLESSHGA